MKGAQIGDASGRIISTRILPPEENEIVMEITFDGEGTLLNVPMKDIGTCKLTFRADGVIEASDGHVAFFGRKGETARLKAFGVGKAHGTMPAARYVSCGVFETMAACWKSLNSVAAISEFHVHEDGSYRVATWELFVD